MRRIRNDFAHRLHGLSFETQRVASRVTNFNILQALQDERGKAIPLPTDTRKRFNLAVALLLLNAIESRIRDLPKFQEVTGAAVIIGERF